MTNESDRPEDLSPSDSSIKPTVPFSPEELIKSILSAVPNIMNMEFVPGPFGTFRIVFTGGSDSDRKDAIDLAVKSGLEIKTDPMEDSPSTDKKPISDEPEVVSTAAPEDSIPECLQGRDYVIQIDEKWSEIHSKGKTIRNKTKTAKGYAENNGILFIALGVDPQKAIDDFELARKKKESEPVTISVSPAEPISMELSPIDTTPKRFTEFPFLVYDLPLEGEDAPPIANDRYLIACDGMGGAGRTRVVVNGEVRKMAYLASRQIIQSADRFMDENYDRIMSESLDIISSEVGQCILTGLEQFVKDNSIVFNKTDRMQKFLPSTFVSVVYKEYEDSIDAIVFWAGDSRAYCVSPEDGLHPLSKDDSAVDYDDMGSIYSQSEISNVSCLDVPFHINYRRYSLKKPCVLFACSDGISQYANSPMDLEAMFIPSGEGFNLCDSIYQFAYTHPHDDRTFAGKVFGVNSFDEFSELMVPRGESVLRMTHEIDECKKEYAEKTRIYTELNR